MTPAKKHPSPEERKQLLQSFSNLPTKDKKTFYQAVGHLRWLMILWDLEEPDPDSMPDSSEKRHILLAYKSLGMLWFNQLPESNSQAFTMYVGDRIPEEQTPEKVNEAFDRTTDELAELCAAMPRPSWVKNVSAAMTSIELFPQRSR
jgi:hypothetical protein